jgi:secreted PhoX family phosphatase
MPWGSWLTCEETVNGPDVGPDFTRTPNVALTRPHGFVFEVPVDGAASGVPIRSAGRFLHESAVYAPEDGALYMTEDNFGFPSGLYRYLPPSDPMQVGRLEDGGRLQMLAVHGRPNADLAASQRRRATYDVEWVDIDEPWREFPYTPGQTAPTSNDDALNVVGAQGRAKGAAMFSRLEGAVHDRGVVWFTSTQGGGPAETSLGPIADGYGNGRGQVWGYHVPSGRLQLLHQAAGDLTQPDATDMDMPDNITTSRRGTLVVCEDGSGDNLLRGLTRGGQLHDIALNRLRSAAGAARFGEEFAGASFSPSGDTLFVNIQASNGLTFAIWGPWERIGV